MRNIVEVKNNKVVFFSTERNKELVEKAIKKILNFFKKSKCSFKVFFINERKEMDQVHGSKTEEWVSGGVYNSNQVYIFSEEIFDKATCHPKESFFSTLVHEISHVYIHKNFKFVLPRWLAEGIAYAVAEQDKEYSGEKKDIRQSFSDEEWRKNYYYGSAGKFTRYLFDRYGLDKMFKLLKSLNKSETKKSFYNKFKKEMGEDFEELFEKWLNS